MTNDLLSVSEVARELQSQLNAPVQPRTISDLFYQRKLPDELAPVIGGRRLISRDVLPQIREALLAQGISEHTLPE